MFPGTGCVLDGSHMNSIDFTLAVIDLAVDAGFEIDQEQYRKDIDWMNSEVDDEDIYLDILNALDWTYEDALEYLNDNTREGLAWEVIDQSLYLVEVDDAG
jgi:hypothetical protein